ncbi:hypothetical protein SAMN02745824_0718 [Parasphingorhabdus marina DSM 22363]|uniref:DinB superfamily protein n=1 Tax=Parasphingorhabdus marina DSM 22363 TaxID=1123272 RepID=A0A1N6CQP2_9SPHN|nr:ClbS/DfsB family four-helix bundle protein [Parasphingorhabdus marina]SIN60674.1 hypothetical protein SAMN02745824_0718 [Parasphingorhabdus marina DSM 22363]
MAATNKAELLQISQIEFQKLSRLIAPITTEQALKKDDESTSIKDVVSHRAHWITLFLGWYADGLAGKTVYFPAKGYKWNDLKRYNSDLRLAHKDVSWSEARKMLAESDEKLADFIQTHTDSELYGGPMAGAHNNWTPGRWAEAAGPSHYRSAGKYIRSRLKSL